MNKEQLSVILKLFKNKQYEAVLKQMKDWVENCKSDDLSRKSVGDQIDYYTGEWRYLNALQNPPFEAESYRAKAFLFEALLRVIDGNFSRARNCIKAAVG